jgi:hypothetical protein
MFIFTQHLKNKEDSIAVIHTHTHFQMGREV